MPKIEIYTSDFCPFCARAKNLLNKKGAPFTEFNVDLNPALRIEMTKRAQGRTSVPQIFFDGNLIGGSDDLAVLEDSGELEALL